MHAKRSIMSSARLVAKVEALLLAKFPRLANTELRGVTLESWLEAAEAWRIAKALEQAGGHRTEAARALGISRRTLYSRMEKLGVDPSRASRAGGEASGSSLRVAAPVPALRSFRAPGSNGSRQTASRSAARVRRRR